jgi:hypothetical protein
MNVASSIQPRGSGCSSASSPGVQALCEACAAWSVSEVHQLLRSGADPNAAGPGNVTPLFACFPSVSNVELEHGRCLRAAHCRNTLWTGHIERCTSVQEETVRLLLQYGADPCLPSVGGDTPLLAAAACSTKLLRVLLEAAGGTRTNGTSCIRSSSSSSHSGRQEETARASSDTACSTIGSPGTAPNESSSSNNSSSADGCSQECTNSLQTAAVLLTRLVCIRGCPQAVQLLLDQGLVPDLQEALEEAVQVSQGWRHMACCWWLPQHC